MDSREPRRQRLPASLALIAFGVLGFSIALPNLPYQDHEKLLDVVRADMIAGATAHDHLRLAEAEEHYRHAVRAAEASRAATTYDPALHAMVLVRLGHAVESQGRIREAERCYRNALELHRRGGNPYDEGAVEPLSRLTGLYDSMGDVANAGKCRHAIDAVVARVEPIHVRAIELQRTVEGADPLVLADKLMELANLYYARGDAAGADSLYQEAFAIRSARASGTDLEVLAPLVRMGLAKAERNENAAAGEILREALALREATHGPGSPLLVRNLHHLGVLAFREGRLEEADSLLTRALAIVEENLGRDPYYAAPILSELATCALERERFASARSYQTRVVRISRRVFGEETAQVGAALLALAEIEEAAGDRPRAREICREALSQLTRAVGPNDPVMLDCENAMLRLSRWLG
jgi:tetratricopeptide (TPR) repeat protein